MIATPGFEKGDLRARGRRGVALVLAICMLALLMAFLIAAQTSVMGTISLISQSNKRMVASRQVDDALALSWQALKSSMENSGRLQLSGSEESASVQVAYERLAAGAPVYAALPGIQAHRDGDALVDVTLEENAPVRRYLINLHGHRSGALRIQ